MAESSRRRRRWIVLLVLVGAAVWYARSRRSAVGDVAQPWPARPERAEPAPVAAVGPEAPAPPRPPSPRPRPAESLPDGSPPGPEYTIKGNAGSMLFHTPSSPYYARTKAEVWFRTPEEATAAGFTEWTPKRRAPR